MKGRQNCFLFFILYFYFSPFAILFSFFSIALLYTPIASPYRMPFGTPFPCLQTEQVLIRLVSFPPTLRVVSFTISVHEGTTKLFPVFKRLFYFSPFCFCRSIFFLFHCVTLHPHRISISELHFVSAGAAGKSLWWIPFRDSCM